MIGGGCTRAVTGFLLNQVNRSKWCVILIAVLSACSNTAKVKPPEPDELRPVAITDIQPTLLWTTNVGDGSERSVVRFTPYVTDNRVFTVNADGVVSALDRVSGELVWEVEIDESPTAGIGGDDEYLYVGTGDGKVFSLDPDSGRTIWSTTVSSEVIAPPTAGAGFVIVRSIDGRVYSLDKNNGSRRWLYTYSVPALSLHGNGRPLVVTDGVLVGLDNGRLAALRDSDGRVFWEARLSDTAGRSEIDRLNDLDGDPVVHGNHIYAVNYQGAVAQIDPGSGRRLWSADVSSSVGLDVNENLVVVTDEFDTVWAFSTLDGLTVWEHQDLSNRLLTAPAITAEGDILVGDFEGYLHVLSGADGEQIGRIKATSGQITNKPVILDNVAYLLGRDGEVSAVAFK